MARRQVFSIAAFLMIFGATEAARADLVVEIEPGIQAEPGTTGNTFDVFLRGIVDPTNFSGFNLILNVTPITPGAMGVTFQGFSMLGTGVQEPPNFIFAGDPLKLGPTGKSAGGTTFEFEASGSEVTVGVNDVFGLGRILFDVAPGVPIGTEFQVSIDPSSEFSNNANPFGGVAFDGLESSTITIAAAPAAVPEPSSLTLLAACGLGGAWWHRRRRASASAGADGSAA